MQTSDYTEHGDAGDVCQHLLHACGGQPLPVHVHQQGGPGIRLQHGGEQAEHEPGGIRLVLLKCQTLFEKAENSRSPCPLPRIPRLTNLLPDSFWTCGTFSGFQGSLSLGKTFRFIYE